MRRLAHLALLPSLFMIFTEPSNRPDSSDNSVVLDIDGAEIRPASRSAKSANARVQTEIRTARGIYYGVTTPFESIVERMTGAPKVPNQTLDLRTPAAEACTPAATAAPAIQIR